MSRRHSPVAAIAPSRLRAIASRLRVIALRLRVIGSRRQSIAWRASAIAPAALFALLLVCALVSRARADSHYRSEAMKVRAIAPPVGWESMPTGSYGRLLAMWSDKEGGKLTLVAARVAPAATAKSLADESRPALARQGFKAIVETAGKTPNSELPCVRLDAQLEEGRRFARQLYIVNDNIGYVLTLIGPTPRGPQLVRDFDDTLATLELGAEPRPTDGGTIDVKR